MADTTTSATPPASGPGDAVARFSPATQAWFRASFPAATEAQRGAWDAISSGRHTLVVAPTGSGKTLAAFLWALDRLASEPVPEAARRCRVLYVSPMKALAVDVERNLRSPLVGIRHAASRVGAPPPDIRVGVRSGDTPAAERRAFTRTPPDVLITTPESLYLLLTSRAREALAGVEWVILDEVHAVAGTKRGAHLALSLERLDALLPHAAQRIGLSATVRPVDEVARYLAGGRPVTVVQPPSTKRWDLKVVVPVPDLAELGQVTDDLSGAAAGAENRTSIWPHVEERIVDLIESHRSTLVFANSRRLAERLTARLNEIHEDRQATDGDGSDGSPVAPEGVDAFGHPAPRHAPAEAMGGSGASRGAPGILARAHHGSVSKEQRAAIEDDLKAGRLPAVVATSSLELGIDMGAIDLVVQVESPPSVASGLQRVGRAGHQVGAVSSGVFFPKYRHDLLQSAVVLDRMRAGAIESISLPTTPLDVLAQQIVAMCALDDWQAEDVLALVRRTASFASLSRPVLDTVLDMLSGLYPSDEFAELRPRVVWDRVTDSLRGRPGAQRLAVTSGGTIPDRGLYGVFLAGGDGPGRRVGELDEEMVYESRVGDVFTLGTSSWRIEDITHDQVLVTPAPGQPGRLPFWKGDSLGRPAELGQAVGRFVRDLTRTTDSAARERLTGSGLDTWAVDNVLSYLAEQKAATGVLPDDKTIVIERFRDEIGDWRIAVHSPYGSPVHAPWALCLAARLRERFGVEVQAMNADDGIVLRLPDVELDDAQLRADLAELVILEPDDVSALVTAEIGGSALFASRFRECASRALLLPRRRPDRRQALWQQRQRSAQLLSVASRYPSFPIVLEAVRECVQDVFDVPALVEVMRRVASRDISVVSIDSASPSPFARSLLFGYVAQYLYEGDSPLAERRAAALSLDPTLLAELLGGDDGASLADLLDPEVVLATEAELQRLAADRQARSVEECADLVRRLGPLSLADVRARCTGIPQEVDGWLHELEDSRRLLRIPVAGGERWAAVEDTARLRDALGSPVPVGVPAPFLEPVVDPLGDLVARYARYRGPFRASDVSAWLGIGPAVATDALRRLVGHGRVTAGRLRPAGAGATVGAGAAVGAASIGESTGEGAGADHTEYCDAEVLRLLRRRSLAALRREVEPVTQQDLARFLTAWQGVGSGATGVDAVLRAVEQLAGARLPASAVESLILPARVRGYSPAWLDELMLAGEVLWQGNGALPGDDGWLSFHVGETAHLTLALPDETLDLTDLHHELLDALGGGGAYFFRSLADAIGATNDSAVAAALWELAWAGRITNDSLTPVRAAVGGRGAHRPRRAPSRPRRYGARVGGAGLAALAGRNPSGASLTVHRQGPPSVAGRWSLLPSPVVDPTVRQLATAEVLLDRYGLVTRGPVVAEDIVGGFAGVYRVLAAAEDSGRVRRGYFVEGLGAAQFGTTGAIDRLRAHVGGAAPEGGDRLGTVLAATDPANPYGAALPWPDRGPAESPEGTAPESTGHRPGRKAGALVVLVGGDLILYVERGGRTLLSWSEDPDILQAAARALASAVRDGALGRLTVEKADGGAVLGSSHPLVAALAEAGFHATPRGLRIRHARG